MEKMLLSDIKISDGFARTTPKKYKMEQCARYWDKYHMQDRDIVVDQNNVLVGGYVMYLVLKERSVQTAQILVRADKPMNYRTNPTTYVYGVHCNSCNEKEYMWRVPESWKLFSETVKSGDKIYVTTKNGCLPVIVTKIEKLDKCPSERVVKKVRKNVIFRNGEIINLAMKG